MMTRKMMKKKKKENITEDNKWFWRTSNKRHILVLPYFFLFLCSLLFFCSRSCNAIYFNINAIFHTRGPRGMWMDDIKRDIFGFGGIRKLFVNWSKVVFFYSASIQIFTKFKLFDENLLAKKLVVSSVGLQYDVGKIFIRQFWADVQDHHHDVDHVRWQTGHDLVVRSLKELL